MLDAVLPEAKRIDRPRQFGVDPAVAAERGGLWLVPLSDGTYGTAFGHRLSTVLRAPLPEDEIERAELVEQSVRAALRVAGEVRTLAPEAMWANLSSLTGQQLVALAVTLAAMVDVESAPSELLAWTEELAS